MFYQEMKDSHEIQIKALLEGNYNTFKGEFPSNKEVHDMFTDDHHHCWCNTGGEAHSIFATLPGSAGCLTQIKASDNGMFTEVNRNWMEKLGLSNNDLIPAEVELGYVFTEAQLREFSRLQLLARYPDGATMI